MSKEIEKIEQESQVLSEEIKAVSIVNQKTYEDAGIKKVTLSSLRKRIKMIYDPLVAIAKTAYDDSKAERDKWLKPVVANEDILKDKIKVYTLEQMEKEKEAQARAEKERAEKEAQAKKDAEAEAKAFGVDVSEVEVKEVEVAAPPAAINKMVGLGIRLTWKAEIVDLRKVPRGYLVPDMTKLNAMARLEKENFSIPGVKAIND